ncbi:hypothetical protein AYO45_04220 [Gammaproteobacteria bacterium SCGC AG-212-F23]|nr:hypothetical protein AYO45_04220 [Gammaproteobacteria bacterium SCGC AG-212-F23]
MHGIDTNVLVRYILQDDIKQARLATDFIENEASLFFINGIVICELVWVLETAYEYAREHIIIAIESILKTRQFCFDDPDILWQALRGYKHDGADFADNYIGYLNHRHQCEYTVTFDKDAARLKHFRQLSSVISLPA